MRVFMNIAAASVAACLVAAPAGAADQPRLVVSLVTLKTADAAERSRFEEYYQVLSTKVILVVQAALRNHASPATYLKKLEVRRSEVDNVPSLAGMEKAWNEQRALQIMVTATYPETPAMVVKNLVYFGDRRGALQDPLILLKQRIVVANFEDTRDLISVATLYSLANDADALGEPRDLVCAFLADAGRLGEGIKSDDDASVSDLKLAIGKSSAAKCGGPR
jgi:hypothetical protein